MSLATLARRQVSFTSPLRFEVNSLVYRLGLSIPSGILQKYSHNKLSLIVPYFCDPTGNRTPIYAVKGRRPNR